MNLRNATIRTESTIMADKKENTIVEGNRSKSGAKPEDNRTDADKRQKAGRPDHRHDDHDTIVEGNHGGN